MMKQWICLLLAAVMVFSLAACGEKAEETTAPTETVPETEAPKVVITSVPDGLVGVNYGDYYANPLLDLEFSLDEGWSFFDQTQLAQFNGISAVSTEAFEQNLKQSGTLCTMFARSEDFSSSASLSFEHMAYVYGNAMTEDEFAELMLKNTGVRQAGIDVGISSAELSTQWLAGEDHPCLEIVYTADGATYYKTQVFILTGDYMAILSGTSTHKNEDGKIVSSFSTLRSAPEPELETEAEPEEEP